MCGTGHVSSVVTPGDFSAVETQWYAHTQLTFHTFPANSKSILVYYDGLDKICTAQLNEYAEGV